MSVPLHHFVFGRACGVVPVKAYASVGAGTCESGGFCQCGLP